MSDRRLLTTDNRLLTTASPLIDGREIDETFWVRLRPNRKSARSIPLASEGRCLRRPENDRACPEESSPSIRPFHFRHGSLPGAASDSPPNRWELQTHGIAVIRRIGGLPLRFWQWASQQTGGKLPLKQQLILFNQKFSVILGPLSSITTDSCDLAGSPH